MIMIKREYGTHLRYFKAWGGAKDTLNQLSDEQIDKLDEILTGWYNKEPIEERELNNFLWEERDYIAELLGFTDFDELLAERE